MGFEPTLPDVGCDEQSQSWKDDFETLRLSFIHENLEIADDKLQTMREY